MKKWCKHIKWSEYNWWSFKYYDASVSVQKSWTRCPICGTKRPQPKQPTKKGKV